MSGNVRGLLLGGRQQIYQPQEFQAYLTREGSIITAKWLNLLSKYFPMNSTGKRLTDDSFRRKRLHRMNYSQEQIQQFLGDFQNYLETPLSLGQRNKIKSIFSQSQTITQKQAIPSFLPKFAQRQAILSVAKERQQRLIKATGIVRLIGQFTDIDAIKWFIWKQVYDHKLRIQMMNLPATYEAIIQDIVSDAMIFAGIGQMNERWKDQVYPLNISGRRILHPMYYGQAQVQVDYNFQQPVYINFDDEQIGQESTKALRSIIFVYMFYKIMPAVLTSKIAQKLGDQALGLLTESGTHNIRNIWRLSIYVKVSDTKTIIPVNFEINPRTLRHDMTGQQVFAQIYVTFARKLLKQYWQSMKGVYKDQSALQRYLQVDQQGQFMSYLKIQGYRIIGRVIAFDTTKQMAWSHANDQIEQIVQGVIKATTQLPPLTTARNMVSWQVYAHPKRGQMNDFQIKTIYGKPCLQQFNNLVQSQGYPQLSLSGVDDLQQIYKYCTANGFGMKMLGQEQPQVWPQCKDAYWVIVYPRHIQFYNKGAPMRKKRQVTNIATYSENKNQKMRGDNRSMSRPTVQRWKIGQQLPLDSSLDPKIQIALRRKCVVIDIESLSVQGQRQTPYMICAVGYLDSQGTPFYRSWTNLQIYQPKSQKIIVSNSIETPICLRNFVDWLALIVHMYDHDDPLMIWGYNMMGYQITYLLLQLQRQFGKVQMQGSPNECKSFSIGQRRVIFADVLKILSPQTLESACDDFQIIIKKKAATNIALVKTWQQVTNRYHQIMEYCFYDCTSTLLLLHKLHCGFVSIAEKIQMAYDLKDITHRLTASGLGWDFFIQGFLKKSIKLGQKNWTQSIIYNLQPQQVYDHQRESFVGGVVQVFKYLWQNKVFVVDINSMYPAMLRNPLPWRYQGEYQVQNLQEIMREQNSNMYLFEVYRYLLPIDFKGAFVATKQLNSTKNTYYNSYSSEDKPIYLRGVIVRRILHHKGSIYTKKCWKYSDGEITAFKQFAEVFYRQRQAVDLESLKVCYKLLMNSVIGRCSMGIKEKYSLSCVPMTTNFTTISDQIYLDVQQPQLPPVGRLVRITAYVTDMARVYLDQLADLAGYDNVCYCDTDSLMVTQKGYQNLGSPGTKATVLGQFKCQAPQKGKALNRYYNRGYFKNRKDYILEYTTKQGQMKYLYKAKGIPKKFITKQFTQSMIASFRSLLPQLMFQPAEYTSNVGDYVRMQVWRREYKKQGVTIKEMLKKSSVIVDRFFVDPQETGICRPGSGYIMQIEDHFG